MMELFKDLPPPDPNYKRPYNVARQIEYPSVEEQLDILYHEGYDGWKSLIKAIKDKHPKPE